MITYIPHFHNRHYSPTEIKNAVKDAYYEIQKEENERKQKEIIEKKKRAEIEHINNTFDEIVGNALVNGEEISF